MALTSCCRCSLYLLCVFLRLWTSICQILRPKTNKIPQAPEAVLKFFFGPNRLEIMEFLSDVYCQYGMFRYEKTIYITEPSLAREALEILDRPASIFAKKDNDEKNSCDPDAMTRGYMSPTQSNLENKRDTIIALIEKTMERMHKSDVCDVSEVLIQMVIDIHGQILLGVDFGALEDKQEKFIEAFNTMIRRTFLKHEINPKSQEFTNAIGTFGRTIGEQLARSTNDSQSAQCLASHLLDPCGKEATMGKLQSFFAAGTIAMESNLALMLDVLARHPKVQEELQREADEMTEYIKKNTTHPSPKLESAMKEFLRFLPPSICVLCKVKEDAVLRNVTIPQGASVEIFLWGMQRSCSRMKNAKEFCFDRFLADTSESSGGQSESFMPFGQGSRTCSGKDIVWLEMKLVLSLFLHNFTFYPVAQTKVPKLLVDWAHGSLAHDGDIVLGVKRR